MLIPQPKRRAAWTKHAFKLIESGIHDYEEVVRQASSWVPEGHAWRRHAQTAAAHRRYKPVREDYQRPASTERRIQMGARIIVKASLANALRYHTLVCIDDKLYLPEQAARLQHTNDNV